MEPSLEFECCVMQTHTRHKSKLAVVEQYIKVQKDLISSQQPQSLGESHQVDIHAGYEKMKKACRPTVFAPAEMNWVSRRMYNTHTKEPFYMCYMG